MCIYIYLDLYPSNDDKCQNPLPLLGTKHNIPPTLGSIRWRLKNLKRFATVFVARCQSSVKHFVCFCIDEPPQHSLLKLELVLGGAVPPNRHFRIELSESKCI